MQHVRQIAQEPHAMGTAAHAEVRGYLLRQMQALGLEPQVQEATVVNNRSGIATVGHVYNLVGRLKGTGAGGKAVLLVAHYDSQPNARGAGDDGAGVAAILETVRALKQAEPLAHDVVVLLSDGEEYGLYGAKAFLGHPWANEVGLVLNLEARGNTGPSMTFELSPQNGWVARQYVQEAPYPFVSSLAYEIYRRMPNDTDFTVFKDAGYSGLNSAFIDGFVHYHRSTDSPENLNAGSLQQHGSNLLALARHFGNTSLSQTKAPDIVFFNLAGSWVVSYPKSLNILWVSLTSLLLLVTLVVGVQKQATSLRQVIIGFFVYLLMLAAVTALFIPVNNLVVGLMPTLRPAQGVHGVDMFFVAYLLLALGLFLLLTWLALRWLRLFSLLMGVFILCYALLLALVPAIFIMFPIVQVVFVAFGLSLPLGMVALLLLLAGLLLPLLVLVEQSFSWGRVPLLPLLLLLLGTAAVAFAIHREDPTPERPLRSHVSYFLNADTGQAVWASAYTTADEWNRQFFPASSVSPLKEVYPHARIVYLKNEAEQLNLAAPLAEVLQDTVAGNERVLRLRLRSQRQAAHLELVLRPTPAEALQSAAVGGKALDLEPIETDRGEVYFARLHGLPGSKAVELELRLTPGAPVELLLYDQSIGLPQQLVKQPRPSHVIAEHGRDSNLTVVRKRYTF